MRNITDSNHTQEKTVRTISWKQEKKTNTRYKSKEDNKQTSKTGNNHLRLAPTSILTGSARCGNLQACGLLLKPGKMTKMKSRTGTPAPKPSNVQTP